MYDPTDPSSALPDDSFDELPGPTRMTTPEAYRYRYPGRFSAITVLKAIDC